VASRWGIIASMIHEILNYWRIRKCGCADAIHA